MGDTACEMGPAKRARGPSPVARLGDSPATVIWDGPANVIPELDSSLPPPHAPPLASVIKSPLPSAVEGSWSSRVCGSATVRSVTSTATSEHAPLPSSLPPQGLPLAHLPQLPSPATGFGLAPAFGHATGLPVLAPYICVHRASTVLPLSAPAYPAVRLRLDLPFQRAVCIHVPPPSALPLSRGQGVRIAPACEAATGLHRQPWMPTTPPLPPTHPQLATGLDAEANTCRIDNTILDILDVWNMDRESRAALGLLYWQGPVGKALTFHLVVALSMQAHCLRPESVSVLVVLGTVVLVYIMIY